MPRFNAAERANLREWFTQFLNDLTNFEQTIERELIFYSAPSEIIGLREQMTRLQNELNKVPVDGPVEIDDALNRLIKMMILRRRHQVASTLEQPRQKTFHPDLLQRLNKELLPFNSLIDQPWFQDADTMRMPRVSDFLTLAAAEKLFEQELRINPREYDEKFKILQAPMLVIPDIRYYREVCDARGLSLAIAYLDIDDFKQKF